MAQRGLSDGSASVNVQKYPRKRGVFQHEERFGEVVKIRFSGNPLHVFCGPLLHLVGGKPRSALGGQLMVNPA